IAAIAVVHLAPGFVYMVAVFTFGAIIAASLLIAWAAEASESSISRGLALAIVAIVQTIPEYFVEGTIAWKAGKAPGVWLHNVIANFTGANRLLTGFGWPLILLTLIVQRRRNHHLGPSTIALQREQSVEVVFMLGASLYYIWVLIQQELTIFDSVVWVGVFVAYMWAWLVTAAPLALLYFISSSVNELNVLVALIPIVYLVSRGGLGSIPLGQLQWIEIFLTMSQSIYACASILDLKYDIQNALVLLVLWVVSTAIIETRLVVGVLFLVLAAWETLRSRGHIVVFSAFRETVRRSVLRKS